METPLPSSDMNVSERIFGSSLRTQIECAFLRDAIRDRVDGRLAAHSSPFEVEDDDVPRLRAQPRQIHELVLVVPLAVYKYRQYFRQDLCVSDPAACDHERADREKRFDLRKA